MVQPIEQVEVGLLQNLVTIVGDPAGVGCLLCDPAFEVDRLYRLCAARGQEVRAVLLTHGHPDHIDGVPEVLRRSGDLPIYIGAAEAAAVCALCESQGLAPRLVPLAGGERLTVAGLAIEVLPTPGHTSGGMSFHIPELAAVLTGDTLFVGSCGRVSFPGSDVAALHRSLGRLMELPEETRVYPGHDYGPTRSSTLAWELVHNPCLRCRDEASLRRLLCHRQPP